MYFIYGFSVNLTQFEEAEKQQLMVGSTMSSSMQQFKSFEFNLPSTLTASKALAYNCLKLSTELLSKTCVVTADFVLLLLIFCSAKTAKSYLFVHFQHFLANQKDGYLLISLNTVAPQPKQIDRISDLSSSTLLVMLKEAGPLYLVNFSI